MTRRLVAGLLLVAAAATTVFAIGRRATTTRVVVTAVPGGGPPLPGIEITGGQLTHGTLERRDATADTGPSTIVVRSAGGSFADHSAVITFPADPVGTGPVVDINGKAGTLTPGAITWPLGTGLARVRGDLGRDELAAIARATSERAGHLALEPPPGLRVASTGPYWPSVEREARYGSDAFGETAALGAQGPALVYAAVTSAPGGLEDEVFARGITARVTVNGLAAVVVESVNRLGEPSQLAGNGELIWEPQAGVTAMVGYSGQTLGPSAIAALNRLAGQTHLTTDAAWRATQPGIAPTSHSPPSSPPTQP